MNSGANPANNEPIDELVLRCLSALPDVEAARKAADTLAGSQSDRATFALCLLTLELALAGDQTARRDLALHVGILLEAHDDPALAAALTAGNSALISRWERVRPVVCEFVAARLQAQLPVQPPIPAQGLSHPHPEPSLPSNRGGAVEGPSTPARPEPAEGLGLTGLRSKESSTHLQPPMPHRPAEPRAGSPMPRLATPVELITEIQEIIEDAPPPHIPPPPTPPPRPGSAQRSPVALPAQPPAPSAVAAESEHTSEETRVFWAFADQALGRMPDPERGILPADTLATARPADRARLARIARSAIERFPQCGPARALSALLLLYVAVQEKERGLLGKNRDRLDMIRTALSLMDDPGAAGQAAVIFETDGLATRRSFAPVIDLLHRYLGFCLRNELDPTRAETHARFCSQV